MAVGESDFLCVSRARGCDVTGDDVRIDQGRVKEKYIESTIIINIVMA